MITPDSGTSEITFPTWALNKVKDKLPEKRDCESDKDFGTLTYNKVLLICSFIDSLLKGIDIRFLHIILWRE